MAYPPRFLRPDLLYFITSRTVDGTLFLRPSNDLNDAIGSILAEAQRRYGVELFEYVFMSNHFHLVARSRDGRLPEFMQYLKANLALTVNRLLGRRGPVWERRYAASAILDKAAQADRATYIYGHGLKEGLVRRPELWPGVASIKQRRSGHRPVDREVETSARRAKTERRSSVSVELSPWPFLNGMTRREVKRQIDRLVAIARERAAAVRGRKPIIGILAVLSQSPWSRPQHELERKPPPLCHAASRRRRRAYERAYELFVADYAQASERFRDGDLAAPFPRYAFRPRLPNAWSPTRAGPAAA